MDATYDGYKGPGYQAQVCETCSQANDVQLVTDVLPQTAADSDSAALPEVVERLEDKGRKPDELLADTAYGSDENVQECAHNGIELLAPVKKRHEGNEEALTALDFEIDEITGKVERCPAGNAPSSAGYSETRDEGYALFERATCERCPNFERCLVYKHKNHYRLKYSKKTLRLETRRRWQETPAFKERYRKRAGVEGLMSALKRGQGFGRLRVRGQPAVDMALYLKAAGHNLLQAARCLRQRRKNLTNGPKPVQKALFGQASLRLSFRTATKLLTQATRGLLLLVRSLPPRNPRALARLNETLLAG